MSTASLLLAIWVAFIVVSVRVLVRVRIRIRVRGRGRGRGRSRLLVKVTFRGFRVRVWVRALAILLKSSPCIW